MAMSLGVFHTQPPLAMSSPPQPSPSRGYQSPMAMSTAFLENSPHTMATSTPPQPPQHRQHRSLGHLTQHHQHTYTRTNIHTPGLSTPFSGTHTHTHTQSLHTNTHSNVNCSTAVLPTATTLRSHQSPLGTSTPFLAKCPHIQLAHSNISPSTDNHPPGIINLP